MRESSAGAGYAYNTIAGEGNALWKTVSEKRVEKTVLCLTGAAVTAATGTAAFGAAMLITSMKSSPRDVYLGCKTGWAAEGMSGTHRNTPGFDMKHETEYETREGWAFIKFLALLLYHKINGMLISGGLIKSFNAKDILYRAASVTQSKAGGTWKICNLSKPLKEIFQNLGGSLEVIS